MEYTWKNSDRYFAARVESLLAEIPSREGNQQNRCNILDKSPHVIPS
jgi:hypothetical protein